MVTNYQDIRKNGQLLKINNFDTTIGRYRIEYYRYLGMIWVLKYKNDAVVEVNNLSAMDEMPKIEPRVRRKIIAVDFDNCLFETCWPTIIRPNKDIIDELKKEQQAYDAAIILWTCRTGEYLNEAVAACAGEGIAFDAINDNIQETKDAFGDGRKIFADEYWDDRAVHKEVDRESMRL